MLLAIAPNGRLAALAVVVALAWGSAYRYLMAHDWIASLELRLPRLVIAALGMLLLAVRCTVGS